MSVILDALKRVQDENRRRETSLESPDEPQVEPANALLRKLASPLSGDQETPKVRMTPVAWVAAAGLAVILVGVAAMWWLQPEFSGPQANDGRPLLTDLSSESRAGIRVPEVSTSPQPQDLQEPFDAADDKAGGVLGELAAEAQDGLYEASGTDLSDLSSGLASDDPVETAAADDSAGSMQLEVAREPAARSNGGVDLSSNSTSAGGSQPWMPANDEPIRETTYGLSDTRVPAGRGSVPSGLVDPGVRTAFSEGVAAQKAGDMVAAEEAYKRALKFDPYNAKVNANLGVLYESQDRLPLAERHLRESINVEPDSAAAHNNLGVVLYRMGKYDSAMIEFGRTLELDPRHLDAYTNRGLIFTRWGRFDDAERSFLQVLALDAGNALAHYNLGLVYEETDQIRKAIDHYYEFLLSGAHEHPAIAGYLDRHLDWLEQRLNTSAGPRD